MLQTHGVKSSEQIESQRSNEEFFMRIPLKALGGFGISRRLKLQTSVQIVWCNFIMAFNNPSSVISAPDSAGHLRLNSIAIRKSRIRECLRVRTYPPISSPRLSWTLAQVYPHSSFWDAAMWRSLFKRWNY